ncbi:hypothetical protein K456DRAFT_53720 [Colletotrichum gloeosporioides 23]|nr:hypothetical protein K456DRAFT_53720 [Colletotrichum gloeosporioides 23]
MLPGSLVCRECVVVGGTCRSCNALQKAQAEVNEALARLDCVRKAKRMVFKKGCKETSVVAGEDEVLEALPAESSLVLEA